MLVCYPFVGDTFGGSHVSTLLLAQNLPTAEFNFLIVVHQHGPLTDHLDANSTPYELFELPHLVRTGGLFRPAIDVLRLYQIMNKFIKERSIDIVHGNDARINQTWAAPTRMARKPYIWHQRARFDKSRLRRHMAKASSSLICISKFTRSRLPTRSLRSKAQIVNDPFDFNIHSNRATAKATLLQLIDERPASPKIKIVGFCGSLTEQKRPDFFLEIAAELAATDQQPLHFILMGNDRDRFWPILESKAVHLRIRNKVTFIGFHSPSEYWLSGMDLLIAPQIEEGFGRTIIESMLVGTPVIASNSGGHPEITNGTLAMTLVPADNLDGFVKSAQDILKNSEKNDRIITATKCLVRSNFSISQHVQKISDIYRHASI